jgi:hypothetical protein
MTCPNGPSLCTSRANPSISGHAVLPQQGRLVDEHLGFHSLFWHSCCLRARYPMDCIGALWGGYHMCIYVTLIAIARVEATPRYPPRCDMISHEGGDSKSGPCELSKPIGRGSILNVTRSFARADAAKAKSLMPGFAIVRPFCEAGMSVNAVGRSGPICILIAKPAGSALCTRRRTYARPNPKDDDLGDRGMT